MRRYALRDDQWDRIKNMLPSRPGTVGVTAKDNRLSFCSKFLLNNSTIFVVKIGF